MVIPVGVSLAASLGTAFTYQGVVELGGVPINGDCDFVFTLWDDATAGTQIGSPVAMVVPVNDGRFTAKLDFGEGAITS